MRATLGITWLLLCLGYLCHIVCSNASVEIPPPTVTPKPTTVPTVKGAVTDPIAKTQPTDDGKKSQATSPPPTTKQTVATTTITVSDATKPVDNPTPSQSQASSVAKNPSTPPASTSHPATLVTSMNLVTVAGVPPGQPGTNTPAGGNNLAVTTKVATTQTSEASVPSKTSGTEAPVSPTGPGNGSVTTKVLNTPTPGQQSTTHTTTNSNTSQEGSKGSATVASTVQAASKATEPAGNTGTTSTQSAQSNKAGPPVAGTNETTSPQATTSTTTITTIITAAQTFLYSLNKGHVKEEEKNLVEVCRRLMANFQDGNCTLTWRLQKDEVKFDYVEINGKVKTSLANQYYEDITKKPTDNKTLIAILASCGALLIMIVILAVCASHHRKPYNENQQHLTEELHTVENGYHDNPTLEVMEVQPEMQEKKMALNGEFNDSWIVPIDNLLKEDIPDEEDTHL